MQGHLKQIAYFKTGRGAPSPLSARSLNRLVRAFNAALNLKINRSGSDQILVSDQNAVLQVKRGG